MVAIRPVTERMHDRDAATEAKRGGTHNMFLFRIGADIADCRQLQVTVS
ncbi:MAG: hypothetical protein MKZ95_11005 [Pirellulales bacterium]|nr:hypothetical protein [Pirellulales bacterium]